MYPHIPYFRSPHKVHMDRIKLYGVKTNNLQNISCEIPMNAMTVLTGVSGSGKSSLAFDTLFAEGQRRYFEAMSTYMRLFLDEMPKPPIERIENCLPAIALRQQSSYNDPRSSVASTSEIAFYLAQIFANAGTLHCPKCGGLVTRDHETIIHQRLNARGEKLRIILYVEVKLAENETAASRLTALTQAGYQRLWNHKDIIDLAEADLDALLDAKSFLVLIDRLIFRPNASPDPRMCEAIEEAYQLGEGVLFMDILGDHPETLEFHNAFACQNCHTTYPPLRQEMFDSNSTLGACETCSGFGLVSGIDWQKVIHFGKSLEDDAIRPFATTSKFQRKIQLLNFCQRQKIPIDVPFSQLKPEQQELVKFGKSPYKGVNGFFDYLQSNNNKFQNRIQLAHYRGYSPCPDCNGTCFSPVSRSVTVFGKTISEILGMTLAEANQFFASITTEEAEKLGLQTPFDEIRHRLQTLCDVGLGYLTLHRRTRTLSGGETQRLHLGCGLGRGLSDTLYVLDEPTAGLHSRDSLKLVKVMESLRDLGNTLVVVEHDTDVIDHADNVIELGPGGGDRGGNIIFQGNVHELRKSKTPTGEMFRSKARTELYDGKAEKKAPRATPIHISGAYANNLKNIDVDIPSRRLVTIAGVSGSGKSSLVHDVLYNWIQLQNDYEDSDLDLEDTLNGAGFASPSCQQITGLDQFEEIVMMEQQSTGRSARSSILTVSRAFNEIRSLFAKQPEAKSGLMTASEFSYNSASGRCPQCEGMGYQTIEMLFMSDIRRPCPLCGGKRYNQDVLSVYYHGKNIADVTDMTVAEAIQFFSDIPKICEPLQAFVNVGLDYVHLGQPSSELSGGEFQRFKLAQYLDRPKMANTLFIFDEPTVGLHMQDVSVLLKTLSRIVDAGASVIVVEHNLDFIAQSHHVIELGPDAGPEGGNIVFQGTPAALYQAETLTAKALREHLKTTRR